MEENINKLNILFDKYELTKEERDFILKIIYPIFKHREFQRRMTKEFLHHSDITLGEHILEDMIVTYILSKKYLKKYNYNLDLSLKIAMLHDLYTTPWQNSSYKTKYFFNKHGFRHPLEAAINAINWYPELFKNNIDSKILIDGIIHHMFPFPVRILDNKRMELANIDLLNKIPNELKDILVTSLKRKRLGAISFSRSLYKEGRIMSKADKRVSLKQIKNFESLKALFTGKNKSI